MQRTVLPKRKGNVSRTSGYDFPLYGYAAITGLLLMGVALFRNIAELYWKIPMIMAAAAFLTLAIWLFINRGKFRVDDPE